MSIVSHSDILKIHAAAIDAGLADRRAALLAGIDDQFVSTLPTTQTPTDQTLSDLEQMNGAEALIDGSVPLRIWLENAVHVAGNRREAEVFRAMLQRQPVGARLRQAFRPILVAFARPAVRVVTVLLPLVLLFSGLWMLWPRIFADPIDPNPTPIPLPTQPLLPLSNALPPIREASAAPCNRGSRPDPLVQYSTYSWQFTGAQAGRSQADYRITLAQDGGPFIPDGGFRQNDDAALRVVPLRASHPIYSSLSFTRGLELQIILSPGQQVRLDVGVCHFNDPDIQLQGPL